MNFQTLLNNVPNIPPRVLFVKVLLHFFAIQWLYLFFKEENIRKFISHELSDML
jgi:hypothetical protein